MVAKTTNPSEPHLRTISVPGSARQFVHTDMIAIITEAEPKTDFNQAGSRLIGTMLEAKAPASAIARALIKASRETGLPVLKSA